MSSPPSTDLGFLSLFPGGGSDSDEETEAPRELSSKELRIQRAIDEGKRTYGRGQAETPAGWFANDEVIKAKAPEEKQLQRYREFHAASLYERRSYDECLAVCEALNALPGYDNREVVDTALRCCLKLQDSVAGERVARGCRSKWMTTPFLAMSSAEVFAQTGLHVEAVKALSCALSARAVQHPPLVLLSTTLKSWAASPDLSPEAAQAVGRLATDVAHVLALSHGVSAAFARPLFEAKKARRDKSDPWDGKPAVDDAHVLADAKELDECCRLLALDARTTGRLHAVYGRFQSMVRRGEVPDEAEDEDDGGVRNL